jgi:hypothetical protein
MTCDLRRALGVATLLGACAGLEGCQSGQANAQATPVYNKDTGKLEALQADANGDGRNDTRAVMDGAVVKHVEIDRDHDGRPDRWEYYAAPDASRPAARPLLERADEANGQDSRITRREYFERGVLARVEEDTDFDGRLDKWELYSGGALVRMDLDLIGRGTADRRLIYGAGGSVNRIEIDPEGDGSFVPAPVAPKGKGTPK